MVLSALVAYRDLQDTLGGEAPNTRFGRRMVERILSDYNYFAEDELDDLLALLRRFATQIARDEAALAWCAPEAGNSGSCGLTLSGSVVCFGRSVLCDKFLGDDAQFLSKSLADDIVFFSCVFLHHCGYGLHMLAE